MNQLEMSRQVLLISWIFIVISVDDAIKELIEKSGISLLKKRNLMISLENPEITTKNAIQLFFMITLIFGFNNISYANSKIRIQLPWYPSIEFLNIYYCVNEGLFKQKGIDVEIKHWNKKSRTDVIEQVYEDKADIGIQDSIHFLIGVDQRKKLISIAAVLQETPLSLVSLSESNIHTINDMEGKTIATHVGYEYLLDFFFKKYPNLKHKVSIKYVKRSMVDLIAEKEVDIGTVFETVQAPLLRVMGKDINIIRYNEMGFDLYSNIIFTKMEYLEKNRKLLKTFLQILFLNTIKMYKTPQKSIDYFISNCIGHKDFYEYHFKNEEEYRNFQVVSFKLNQYFSQKGVGEYLGLMNKYRWKAMIKTLKEIGVIKNNIDENEIMTNDLLKDLYNN